MYRILCRTNKKENIMSAGTNNFRTSTLTRHAETSEYQILIQGSNFNIKKSTDIAWGNVLNKESLAVITAMKAVYFLAKEFLPLSKYPKILELFKNVKAEHINDLTLNSETMYNNWYICDKFLAAINETLFDDVSVKLQKATHLTILTDESTDITQHKKHVI